MSAEPMYVATLESNGDGRQIARVTGERATVIEAVLRCALDCAPVWNDSFYPVPAFRLDVRRIDA